MREWLKLMLEEIRRREAEEEAAAAGDASDAAGRVPAPEPGKAGSDDGASTHREGSTPPK
jgi:hypothetical protein